MPPEPGPYTQVTVSSLFGARTQQGLVAIQLGANQVNVAPAEARHIARLLIEAAAAGESDEVFWRWATRIGMDEQQRSRALVDLRKMRGEVARETMLGDERTVEDLRRRAEVILSALGISHDMRPRDATDRATVRELLMEHLARAQRGDDPEA